MSNITVGWDIGGAHLKVVACNEGGEITFAEQLETPLWKGLDVLDNAIKQLPAALIEKTPIHALTMTGELADIFPDRTTGVNELVKKFSGYLGSENIQIYAGRKGWLRTDGVQGNELDIASANWSLSAEIINKNNGIGLFIDIGSTTTDLIPIVAKGLDNHGYSDYERLRCDELVYSGVIRTPIPAIVSIVPFAGEQQRIATEYFATMGDVYKLIDALPAEAEFSTADGKGCDHVSCTRRLARLVGCDAYNFPLTEWQQLAGNIADQYQQQISQAIGKVMSRYPTEKLPLIGAGVGRFLIKKIAREHGYTYHDFSEFVHGNDELKEAAALYAPAASCAILSRSMRRSQWAGQNSG